MGCSVGSITDVEGCKQYYFTYQGDKYDYCNKRVYACTSWQKCIHCGSLPKNFIRSYDNKTNITSGLVNHSQVYGTNITSKSQATIDNCIWCSEDFEVVSTKRLKTLTKNLKSEGQKVIELQEENTALKNKINHHLCIIQLLETAAKRTTTKVVTDITLPGEIL